MSIHNTLNQKENEYQQMLFRLERAYKSFARKTERERQTILSNFQEYMTLAGDDGLAFLLLSNNSVASNNELYHFLNLEPQEALLIAGAAKNLATGKAVDDGLPPLPDKIKLLAQQHLISSQINALEDSPHSADMDFDYAVSATGAITDIVGTSPTEEVEYVDPAE